MQRPERQSSRSGSVLVAMLGLIAFMAALLISFMSEATERIKYNGLLDERSEIRETAYSAMETALASINEIAEISDRLRSQSQGWWEPIEYAGVDFSEQGYGVSVKLEDESAKLPLANMDETTLLLLFDEMEVNSREAEDLANALLDWMDDDDAARINSMDGDDYEEREPPYRAANAVPSSWEEFRLIDGFEKFFWDEDGRPTPEFEQFKSAVSLYNTGKVNINNAPLLVLEVLARIGGFDPDQVEDQLAGDDNVRGNADDLILTSAKELGGTQGVSITDFEVSLLRVEVTVTFGDAHYLLSALVKWSGSNAAEAEPANISDVLNNPYSLFPDDPQAALGYPFKVVRISEGAAL